MSRQSYRNILVIRLSALGDVAITLPVLYPICRANPERRFVVLTRRFPAQIFDVERPDNLTVVGINTDNYKGLGGLLRLARELRRDYRIDAVADLHSVLRSHVIDAWMRLHGIAVARIDKGRGEKHALTSGKIHRQLTTTHARYKTVFHELGITARGNHFTALKPSGDSTLLGRNKGAGERWIAVAPFSQHKGKEYPLEKVAQVVAKLAANQGVTVLLFGGGEKEKAALAPLAAERDNVVNVAAINHRLKDELRLMSQCDVMLSMDSANMHLASLVGLRVVSIWGATHPYCGFMGYGQSIDDAVQRTDLPCRPCSVFGNKPCRYGDYRCLSELNPDDIARLALSERKTTT